MKTKQILKVCDRCLCNSCNDTGCRNLECSNCDLDNPRENCEGYKEDRC